MFSFFQRFFIIFIIIFFLSEQVFALPKISSVLPRPTTDVYDEYIEIQNPDCEDISLENYKLANSRQQFIFTSEKIEKHEKIQFSRKQTGLMLRDAWDTIKLFSSGGELIDEITYSSLDKGETMDITHENTNCENNEKTDNIEDNSTENNSTETATWSQESEEQQPQNPQNSQEEDIILIAEELELSDENGDGFFENIKIIFPEILTWTLDIEDFSLKNFSGGIAEDVLEDSVFLSGSLDQNSILLTLTGVLTEENILKNQENTGSGIFLYYTLSDKITGISGAHIQPIDEKSFENYSKIIKNFSKNTEENPIETVSGTTDTSTGETIKDSISFPEIVPALQRSTTAELRWNTFFCDENPCSVNLNFEHIFSQNFLKKDFSCELIAGMEKYTTCNPPQMRFTSETDIIVRLIHNQSKQEIFSTFSLDFSEISSKIFEKTENPIKPLAQEITPEKILQKNFYPEIIVKSDGKFEKIYEWRDDERIECLVSTCSVNLNANDSYTQNDATLRFEWKFGDISQSNRKNPTAVIFPAWEHIIEVTATDTFGKFSKKTIVVIVPAEDIKPIENTEKNTENTGSWEAESEWENFLKNFEIPEFILQNPVNFTIENEEKYICSTKTNNCSINLSLSETDKNFSYIWKWNHEEPVISMNPRSKSLELGTNELILQILDKNNEIIASKKLIVQVNKITTTKAKKTTTKTTNTKNTKQNETEENTEIKEKEIEKPVEIMEAGQEVNHWPMSLAGMLFSGLFFTRKRFKK